MVSVGDESDVRMAALKLQALGRNEFGQSIRGALPGRITGARASKAMLVVADAGLAILGGVDWSGFLKPAPHPQDVFFRADDVQAVLIRDNYGILAHYLAEVPSRLQIREDRVQAISIAGSSGEVLTFIPNAQGFPLEVAKEVAGIVSDNVYFKAAVASLFNEETDVDVTIMDGRLFDKEAGTLLPGLLAFGGSDDQNIGFFEPGHFLGRTTRIPEPVIESLYALDDCIVHLPPGMTLPPSGFESIRTDTNPSALYLDLRFFPDEQTTRMLLAPGRRGAANEYALGLVLPLLALCNTALSPVDYTPEYEFPDLDDYP